LQPGSAGEQWLSLQPPAGLGQAGIVSHSGAFNDALAGALTTVAGLGPLWLSANASPDPVAAGQAITYTINVDNLSSSGTGNFLLHASVPNNTTVTADLAGGASCSTGSWPCRPGSYLYWTLSLNPTWAETLHFSALVSGNPTPPAGTALTSVLSTGLSGSSSATAYVATRGPVLTLSAPGEVAVAANYDYTLTLGNPTTSTLSPQIVMPIPIGTTFVSSSGGVLSGSAANGTVTWTLGPMSPGRVVVEKLTVAAATTAPTLLTAFAVATDSITSGSARAILNTAVAPLDPLQISVAWWCSRDIEALSESLDVLVACAAFGSA
jgi:uncharacterized repeat protein (TIGR01451 family)